MNFSSYKICAVSAIIFLLLLSEVSEAGTYYVSPTGAATWSACSNIDSPCSYQTAMANAVAGDLVYFRGGTYTLTSPPGTDPGYIPAMTPAHSGTENNYITFRAYTGETPIIPGAASWPAFGVYRQDWIEFDGFQSTMAADTGLAQKVVSFANSNHCRLKNCILNGVVVNSSLNHSLIQIDNSNYIDIFNNLFANLTGGQVNTTAIWVMGTANINIYQNTFSNCYRAVSWKFLAQSYIYIYRNFMPNVTQALKNNNSTNGTAHQYIYQNVAIISGSGARFIEGYDPVGTSSDFQCYNNTIYLTGTAIVANVGGGTTNFRDTKWWNNIIYGAAGTTTSWKFPSGVDKPTYCDYNNLYTAGTYDWRWGGISISPNIITNWRSISGFDSNTITTNPNFVNAGGSTAADYKRTSYPANGRGGSYASVMGAYIDGTEVIGYQGTPPSSPEAPKGLRVLQ